MEILWIGKWNKKERTHKVYVFVFVVYFNSETVFFGRSVHLLNDTWFLHPFTMFVKISVRYDIVRSFSLIECRKKVIFAKRQIFNILLRRSRRSPFFLDTPTPLFDGAWTKDWLHQHSNDNHHVRCIFCMNSALLSSAVVCKPNMCWCDLRNSK